MKNTDIFNIDEAMMAEVNPHNYDSDEDYYAALKAPAKRRSAPNDYPYSQEDDDAYFRELFRKQRAAKAKAERDADHDRLATGTNEAMAEAGVNFRAGNTRRQAVNAMSPEEQRAHDLKRQEQQRKRDDARMERERQRNAAKKDVAEGSVSDISRAARLIYNREIHRKVGETFLTPRDLGKFLLQNAAGGHTADIYLNATPQEQQTMFKVINHYIDQHFAGQRSALGLSEGSIPDYEAMFLKEFASCGGTGGIATSMSVGNPKAGSLFGGSYSQPNSPFKKTAKKRTGKMIKR